MDEFRAEERSEKNQFCHRLCSALALRGVRQKDLAKELGVKDNVISYYCSGARVPKLEQVITISRFLNVPADYLLGLSGVLYVNAGLRTAETATGLNKKSIKAIQAIGTEKAMGNFVVLDRGEYDDLVRCETLLKMVLASVDEHGFADRGIISAIQALVRMEGAADA